MPRKRKALTLDKPRGKYKITIYTRHPSGIGCDTSRPHRVEYIDVKPTGDTHWFDLTNGEWARWDTRPYNA
jgi:hypothetical protein